VSGGCHTQLARHQKSAAKEPPPAPLAVQRELEIDEKARTLPLNPAVSASLGRDHGHSEVRGSRLI